MLSWPLITYNQKKVQAWNIIWIYYFSLTITENSANMAIVQDFFGMMQQWTHILYKLVR